MPKPTPALTLMASIRPINWLCWQHLLLVVRLILTLSILRAFAPSPPTDMTHAQELGFQVKLLGIAKEYGGRVEQRVHPLSGPSKTAILPESPGSKTVSRLTVTPWVRPFIKVPEPAAWPPGRRLLPIWLIWPGA